MNILPPRMALHLANYPSVPLGPGMVRGQVVSSIDPVTPFDVTAPMPLVFSGEFLEWAVVFFVIAIIAAVFGARGIAGVTMTVAKWFVFIFLVLAVISILL